MIPIKRESSGNSYSSRLGSEHVLLVGRLQRLVLLLVALIVVLELTELVLELLVVLAARNGCHHHLKKGISLLIEEVHGLVEVGVLGDVALTLRHLMRQTL